MPAPPNTRTIFELQPMVPLSQPWQWWVLGILCLLLTAWTLWIYRRDSVDLRRPSTTLLMTLRLLALSSLLLFVLNPGRRSETRIVKPSRLVMLVDDSLSMGLTDAMTSDTIDSSGNSSGNSPPVNRMAEVKQLLQSPVLETLQQEHQVAIYSFSDSDQPTLMVETDQRSESEDVKTPAPELSDVAIGNATPGRLAWAGLIVAVIAFVAATFVSMFPPTAVEEDDSRFDSWRFVTCVITMLLGIGAVATADIWQPDQPLARQLGFDGTAGPLELPSATVANINDSAADPAIDQWLEQLTPAGTSTRIGSAIQAIVNREQGGPMAGIVLVTDGQSNGGMEINRAVAAASNAGIPIFTVGIGSPEMPRSIAITDLQSPSRVYPGDRFQIRATVQAFGMEGRTAVVRLIGYDASDEAVNAAGQGGDLDDPDRLPDSEIEDELNVRLGADGQAVPVEFSTSREPQGKRGYIVRIEPMEGDLDANDNQRLCVVEVVRQKTRVLLIAGGPTREFRFLRNQLYRDEEIWLAVWLQSATIGADQESDVLLQSFPETREELFEFDCIIAFDPDWRDLSLDQTRWMEKWISEQAGGLITVAGPVNTPQWTRQPRGDQKIDIIRRVYPVSFYNQGSAVLKLGRFGGTTPYPLAFTRQGRSAEYLWIGDSAGLSQETWSQFDGVFGYYAVNDPKAGAEVLANFGDPETEIDDIPPIYLASQFYGAGRTFFQASGEMWRVRRLSVRYFQEYYTKLIRWASQGRLNRQSSQGVMLTDRQRCWMGDTIVVQAILKDAQDQPLNWPEVSVSLRTPNDVNQTITLRSSAETMTPGTYSGSFVASGQGTWRLQMMIPESPLQDVLTASVVASIPDLEKERPQRNDDLLSRIAANTGGAWYQSTDQFNARPDNPLSVAQLIRPQDQESIIAGTFDRYFRRKIMIWSFAFFATCLSLEWLLRRLQKLA